MADVGRPAPKAPQGQSRAKPRRQLPVSEPQTGKLGAGAVTVAHTAGPYDWLVGADGWVYVIDTRTGKRLKGAQTSERAAKKIVEQLNDLERPWTPVDKP